MSQLVKTKPQANLKDFKRFGTFKGLAEQKKQTLHSTRPLMPKNPNLHTNYFLNTP
jgi:hypothetical protein